MQIRREAPQQRAAWRAPLARRVGGDRANSDRGISTHQDVKARIEHLEARAQRLDFENSILRARCRPAAAGAPVGTIRHGVAAGQHHLGYLGAACSSIGVPAARMKRARDRPRDEHPRARAPADARVSGEPRSENGASMVALRSNPYGALDDGDDRRPRPPSRHPRAGHRRAARPAHVSGDAAERWASSDSIIRDGCGAERASETAGAPRGRAWLIRWAVERPGGLRRRSCTSAQSATICHNESVRRAIFPRGIF